MSQGKSVILISSGLKHAKEYTESRFSQSKILHHAAFKEKDNRVVHTRINYPNPRSLRLYKGIHAFSLFYFEQEARISHSPI